MSSSLPFPRIVLIAGILALGLSACGRRGALEPPPDPSAPQQTTAQPSPGGALPSPVGTNPSNKTHRGFTIPKDRFILDPIL
ncbi:LPS translocon maturation chaperone LptM [Microvirga rosea]|uniref:LPS translocon maturation chaperone LptM n=1 Tax=Microvirga rosea TaxID=2715425 RepID=UPI001D0BB883|nr:lipoprotein [Microvirga rosea]MCB8819733.1 lipoprotein [Microvirga rosea]